MTEKNIKKEEKEGKEKFALYIRKSTLNLVKKSYEDDNCASQSEFIEKAIQFYCGYLSCNSASGYVPRIVESIIKSIIAESDSRIGRLLFKMSVEQAVMGNLLASKYDISKTDLEKLTQNCVNEVKRINGAFGFDDAVKWQKGEQWQD